MLPSPEFSPLKAHLAACHPSKQPHPRTLRSDQFTALSTAIRSLASLSSSPSPPLTRPPRWYPLCWSSGETPPLLPILLPNWPITCQTLPGAAPPSPSCSNHRAASRFLPRFSIRTRAVLVCDDDVEGDLKTVEFTFRMWRRYTKRLIGIFVRSHDIDMTRKEWIYTVHPDKYSIVLTKFMMMKGVFVQVQLRRWAPMREMRRMVDEMSNCEDILMNFVVAEQTNAGPLILGAEKARDWEDPRNEDDDGVRVRLGREVGLSSRRGEHRKRRGDCITEFHRIFGRRPLRYSYAKLVSSIGEQGLCKKGADLVLCDHPMENISV